MHSLKSAIIISLKHITWNQTAYHVTKLDIGHTHLMQKHTNDFCQSLQKHQHEGKGGKNDKNGNYKSQECSSVVAIGNFESIQQVDLLNFEHVCACCVEILD